MRLIELRSTWAVMAAALALGSGCHRDSPGERTARTTAALTGARTFSLTFPAGVGPDQVVLGAQSGELEVDDLASVTSSANTTLSINTGSTGLNQTEVGNRTTVTGLESVGPVELEDHTIVTGSVTSGGTVSTESTDTIAGTVTQNATLTPLFPVTWTATPPGTSGGDVDVSGGRNKALAPGAYGEINVFSNGTLTLSPGSYFFEQLQVFPQATLAVQHQQQPVLVYVASGLLWQGTVQDGGDASHLLVGFGGNLAPLQSPFRGTVIAPGAQVQLFGNSTPHVGSFFGSSVQVAFSTSVQFAPFAHWGLFVAPILTVTCVMEYTSTNFGALFGYTNLLSTPFTIADGPDNQFVPAVPNFVPLTTFAPGTHPGTLGVPLPGNAETWQVRNMSVQATRTTLPACTGDETRIALTTPVSAGVDPDHPGPASASALQLVVPNVP